jgi:hypothetical protein
LFGGAGSTPGAPASPAAAGTPAPGATSDELRPDEGALFGTREREPELSQEAAPEDPLRIGGQLYLRLLGTGYEGYSFSKSILTSPNLFDAYFDARPNDRVRGMVIGRISYNPLATSSSALFEQFTATPSSGTGQAEGSAYGSTQASESTATSPSFILNQMWLRFDVGRTVFATVGKQFVKWGTSRFWNPTDFLQPVRRNPLEPFDVRTGVPMIKLHLPWEAKGWNLYAIGLLDNYQLPGTLNYVAATSPAYVSGAARGEIVLSTVEIGVDTLIQKDHPAKLGLDVSAGVGPIDVYAEAALRRGVDGIYFKREESAIIDPYTGSPVTVDAVRGYFKPDGVWPSISGGANWSTTVRGNSTLTLGAEYFYNSLGYDDPSIYPYLLLSGVYQPFYVGKHYGSIYGSFIGPSAWNYSSFTLSTLGNLSDRSFITRLDYSVKVLTFLQVEAYGAVHYGEKTGEFRAGYESLQPISAGGRVHPPFSLPPQLIDLGVSLRINI